MNSLQSTIRVLLVDDAPIALHILQRLLSGVPHIQVVGTATNGKEALELLPSLNPDVICTDLHMPVMDGLELTQEVMNRYPLPILVVSVSVEADSPNIFRLLEAGAVDVFPKPRDFYGVDQDSLAKQLASKIRILSGVHVFRHPAAVKQTASSPPSLTLTHSTPLRIVVIGASTGGPQALRSILSCLPAGFPLPILCVQHIGSDFLTGLVTWLNEACPLPVRKAIQDELPQAGVVYLAPEHNHLELDDSGRFSLTQALPCDGHRPSVTITMRAAARHYGSATVGVLLTGMGRDGAVGMAEIAAVGGITIVQDEASSVVYGMPRAAVELGAVRHLLPLEQVAPALIALANNSYKAATSSQRKVST